MKREMKIKGRKDYHRSYAIKIRVNNDILQCVVFKTYGTLPLQKQLMLQQTLLKKYIFMEAVIQIIGNFENLTFLER